MKNFLRKLLPQNFYKGIKNWFWLYTDWVSYKSYSSEGEDMILRKIFHKKERGYFVDIGAFHPKKASNTFYFYKNGWSGINIDAMPGSMKLFNQSRKRDVNLEIPIGKDGEKVKYYEFEDKALNGFESPALQDKDASKPQNRLNKIYELECKSLNSVLDKFLPEGKIIDFISIDVEGQEFRVLEDFDFLKYRPEWILTEVWDFSMERTDNGKVDMLLKSKGYLPRIKTLNTVFYQLIHE